MSFRPFAGAFASDLIPLPGPLLLRRLPGRRTGHALVSWETFRVALAMHVPIVRQRERNVPQPFSHRYDLGLGKNWWAPTRCYAASRWLSAILREARGLLPTRCVFTVGRRPAQCTHDGYIAHRAKGEFDHGMVAQQNRSRRNLCVVQSQSATERPTYVGRLVQLSLHREPRRSFCRSADRL